MARRVSFRYTDFLRCPYCGRILEYLTEKVRDRHSPDGYALRHKVVKWMAKERISPDDKQVTKVVSTGRGGYEGEARTMWEHSCDVLCENCNLLFSSKDERIVRRVEPDDALPGDFWTEV